MKIPLITSMNKHSIPKTDEIIAGRRISRGVPWAPGREGDKLQPGRNHAFNFVDTQLEKVSHFPCNIPTRVDN